MEEVQKVNPNPDPKKEGMRQMGLSELIGMCVAAAERTVNPRTKSLLMNAQFAMRQLGDMINQREKVIKGQKELIEKLQAELETVKRPQ